MAKDSRTWGYAGNGYGELAEFEVWFNWSDYANNISQFGYKVSNNSNNSYGDTGDISMTISDQWNGNRVSQSRGNTPTYSNYQSVNYFSGTFLIYHNEDGTMPDINFVLNMSRSLGNIRSVSIPITLRNIPTIPRQSSITSVVNTVVPDNSSLGVYISAHASAYRHVIDLRIGSRIIQTWGNLAGGRVDLSMTTATIDEIIKAMPNSTTLAVNMAISTWQGSTKIGSTTTFNFQMSLGTSIVPAITGIAHAEAVAAVSKLFTVYVRGKSQVKVTVNRNAGKFASIKQTSVTIDGVTSNGNVVTSALLNKAGSIRIVAEVVDSRNRKASSSTTINVVDYVSPTISSLTAQRTNASGVPVDDSAIITVKFNYAVASVSNQNTGKFELFYRKKGTTSWTKWTEGTGLSGTKTFVSGAIFDIDYSYEIQLNISDKFGPINKIIELPTAFTLMDFHSSGKGMAIGKVSEVPDILEIDLRTVFNNHLFHNVDKPVLSFNGALPAGNLSDVAYLQSLKPGMYVSNNSASVLNKPSAWAFVIVNKSTVGSGGDGVIEWSSYVNGSQWRRGWNSNGLSPWIETIDSGNVGNYFGDRCIEHKFVTGRGEYWKYESGLLIQKVGLNAANTSPPASLGGGWYYRYFGNQRWDFPIAFVGSLPSVQFSSQGAVVMYDNIELTNVRGIYQARPVNHTFSDGWRTAIAIGSWK